MASIDLGGGRTGKKAVDTAVPLIPFIDLLLCCIMFLLVTAVWNELASLNASLETPGSGAVDALASKKQQLTLSVRASGYAISSSAGDEIEIPRIANQLDVAALGRQIARYAQHYPDDQPITIEADDGIPLAAVVDAMDVVRGSGFTAIQL